MTTERYIRIGRLIAVISFLLGTAIFAIYFLTSSSDLLLIGYYFIVLAALINIIILLLIFVRVARDTTNRRKLLRTSALMLLNIPVMLAYYWLIVILLGTIRITFTNDTGTELTDIKVVGCGGGYIEKLRIRESKTVWVKITGDCSISVQCLSNRQRKSETVAGYVTSSMGQKANYNIGKPETSF